MIWTLQRKVQTFKTKARILNKRVWTVFKEVKTAYKNILTVLKEVWTKKSMSLDVQMIWLYMNKLNYNKREGPTFNESVGCMPKKILF